MMEGVFFLPEVARTGYLRSIVQSVGCAYICLWSFDPTSSPNNRLFFLDGFYNNVRNNQQASSSLGSVAQQLFNQFRTLRFDANDDRIPGLAFRNNRPYVEVQQPELLRLAWTQIQKQFFQEARIKTAVFMGCNKGEIELGFLNLSQAEIQTALNSLFQEDFSSGRQIMDHQNNPPSSSSSSLRSLSTTAGSPEYSSLLFNIPPAGATAGAIVPNTMSPLSSNTQSALLTNYVFPSHHQEIENETLMRVFLNAISPQQHQNLPYNITVVHPESSAFKRYRTEPEPGPERVPESLRSRQSLMKRSLAFFRSINAMRIRERIQATRPSSTQLHHMIAERRRREKLNDNFQALRALLPPGTKKDKASILTTAKETLSSLMAEIEKLRIRNHELESRLPENSKESSAADQEISKTMLLVPPNERFHVQISDVPQSSSSSSSEERRVDLHVALTGQISQIDAVIRLLEFLKLAQNVSLVTMRTNTNNVGQGNNNYINQLTFRLRILEGSEWDVSAFQEAVKRVVGDLAQFQVDH
ncbi:putative transcription factor bHLH041 [Arachis stenosperma]|uniref:putative transcription factor bHLH041 n=1 Tax=Arachis stenosperma TaxID=217475 RepID=UPI0025AC1950|nr:putative transcription factor bHLH041 [Arachis stenosperma]